MAIILVNHIMSNLPDATAKIVSVLAEFNTEERIRIVKASLTLLGDEFGLQQNQTQISKAQISISDLEEATVHHVPTLVQQWMRKN